MAEDMTNTQKKLDEAKYFLDQLNVNDPYFDYILSAFLNAARSTLWVMRHEFGKIPDWRDWFDAFEATGQERTLLAETNQMRIDSAKKGEMNTEYFLLEDTLRIDEESYPEMKRLLSAPDGTELEITIRPIDEDEAAFDAKAACDDYTVVLRGYVKPERERVSDPRPAIKCRCDEYFAFLTRIVRECHRKFEGR